MNLLNMPMLYCSTIRTEDQDRLGGNEFDVDRRLARRRVEKDMNSPHRQ